MAFSNPGFSAALQAAIDYAWASGSVLVAATGNDGAFTATFPAGDRGVIGVTSTDPGRRAVAASANRGPAAFMAAPGVDILTTASFDPATAQPGDEVVSISGTSAAAASVAGAAALLAANEPELSNGVVVSRLARTADAAGDPADTGNGRLNLHRAMADTSLDELQPAGAAPVGNGGPLVGPYIVAAPQAAFDVAPNHLPSTGTTVVSVLVRNTQNGNGNAARCARVTLPASVDILSFTFTVNATSGTWAASPVTAANYAEVRTTTQVVGSSPNGLIGSSTRDWVRFEITAVSSAAATETWTVSSISRDSATPTGANSVAFTVTFNESVTGVNAADFALTTTGVSGASVGTITGTRHPHRQRQYRHRQRHDSIGFARRRHHRRCRRQSARRHLQLTGEVYTIDKTLPSVSSIVRASTNPTNASSVAYTVTFSESVTGVNAADFTLSGPAADRRPIATVTGSGTTYTVNVSTGSGSGTIRLDCRRRLDPGRAAIGWAAPAPRPTATSPARSTPSTRPTPSVSSIDRASPNPTNAASVAGRSPSARPSPAWMPPTSTWCTGVVTGASITSVSGSGTTCTVTVSTGSGSGTLGLNLADDDSIQDLPRTSWAAPAPRQRQLHRPGLRHRQDRADGHVDQPRRRQPDQRHQRDLDRHLQRVRHGVDAADFALATSGVSGASITGVSGSGTTYTVTASTGTGDGTLGLNLVDNDSITDAAGNPLGGTGCRQRQLHRPGLRHRQDRADGHD